MSEFLTSVAKSRIVTWVFMLVVSIMTIILSSIVIAWINAGKVNDTEVTKKTAKNLSIVALIPALLAMIVVVFKIICAYTPLSVSPICMIGSGGLGAAKSLLKGDVKGAAMNLAASKMPGGMASSLLNNTAGSMMMEQPITM